MIGFRDWGLDRLELALRAHAQAAGADRHEVIVSDYGSADADGVRAVAEEGGARLVRTEVDGPWSRARALNEGIAAAAGAFVATTDSDLLFSPATSARIVQRLRSDPRGVLLVQCRNLTDGFDVDRADGLDWDELERNSAYRPRWGMGGLIAITREALLAVGGYDDRMEIYGSEDRDLAQRLRWDGLRHAWIDEPDVRIYHVWHPSTHEATKRDADANAVVERNRALYLVDKTIVRSLRRRRAEPLATVAIATRDRAHFLGQCLDSVLAQTFENFEVLVVDDGSEDDTPELVAGYDDPRVRYVREEGGGVPRARNRAVAEARAPYVIVHDDDDLMLPWRIEAQFSGLTQGLSGTYGGWVDFDDVTGELTPNQGKAFSLGGVLYGSRIYLHPTLMVRRDVLQRVPYDERLLAGSDFNLAIRLGSAGVQLGHSGEFHILRRQHGRNLSDTLAQHQRAAARRSTGVFRRQFNRSDENSLRTSARELEPMACRGADDLRATVGAFLPDALTTRVVRLRTSDDATLRMLEEGGAEVSASFDAEGERLERTATVATGVTWAQMRRLRAMGAEFEARVAGGDNVDPETGLVFWLKDELEEGHRYAVVSYAPAGSAAGDALWNADGGRSDLVEAGEHQLVTRAALYEDRGAALEELERRAAADPDTATIAIDLAVEPG